MSGAPRRVTAALLSLAVLASFAHGVAASVYGRDDRRGAEARTAARFEAVGLVYAHGHFGAGGSATLVAARRILTAAHVVYRDDGALRLPLSSLRFRLGHDFVRDGYREFAITGVVASGDTRPHAVGREHLDWVVLEIDPGDDAPLPQPVALAHPDQPTARPAEGVQLAGFHRDVGGGLRRVASACTLLALPSGAPPPALLASKSLRAHDCDAAGMSSGAGLFRPGRDGRGFELVALHVGQVGPARAPRADLARDHFNVAIEIGPEIRAAVGAR